MTTLGPSSPASAGRRHPGHPRRRGRRRRADGVGVPAARHQHRQPARLPRGGRRLLRLDDHHGLLLVDLRHWDAGRAPPSGRSSRSNIGDLAQAAARRRPPRSSTGAARSERAERGARPRSSRSSRTTTSPRSAAGSSTAPSPTRNGARPRRRSTRTDRGRRLAGDRGAARDYIAVDGVRRRAASPARGRPEALGPDPQLSPTPSASSTRRTTRSSRSSRSSSRRPCRARRRPAARARSRRAGRLGDHGARPRRPRLPGCRAHDRVRCAASCSASAPMLHRRDKRLAQARERER